DGPLSPHDLLQVRGVARTGRWLMEELATVYRSQGIDLDDKHLEVVVARMLARVKVRDAGRTDLLPGALVERAALRRINAGRPEEGRARGTPVLLGISKAALQAGGFLSAASFQET